MRKIQDLVDQMSEEIEGAKTYAETYLDYKAKGNSNWAAKYKSMAEDELKHATYIHDRAMEEITELNRVFKPPVEMEQKWTEAHKWYVERVSWVKMMLQM